MEKKTRTWAFLAIFLCGAGIRALDLGHGIDGGVRESWREADYGAVARNFVREEMNILRPRIDWRGTGPGLAEMEFPAVPWLTAVLYRAFGYNEIWGRVVSYLFSGLTLLVFFALARRLLPGAGAGYAAAFFVLAPLSVRLSNALQPEAMMLFFYIGAVWAFNRWLEKDSPNWYILALLAAAAAILAKIPAAHLGVFFIFLLIERKGWKSLFTPRVLAFGILALLPAALWWVHAHRFWLVFGNSLGVSNEYHWIGWDVIANPRWILAALYRILRIEGTLTAMVPGLLIAPFVLWTGRRNKAVRFSFFWLAAVAVYYLVTIRTTGDFWASYYHVVSVPPFALLLGFGFSRLDLRSPNPGPVRAAAGVSFALALALIGARQFLHLGFPRIVVMVPILFGFSIALAAAIGRLSKGCAVAPGAVPQAAAPLFRTVPIIALFLMIFPLEGFQTARDLHPVWYEPLYHCAIAFKPLLEPDSLILASGAEGYDETGKQSAFNASYMFFWLDHKGFNIAQDRQILEEVASFVRRGARYFILEKDAASVRPDFLPALRRTYRLLAECPAAYLFDLFSFP